MSVFALIAWVITILGGLFLLAIWLIEYDPDFQRAAATRLPVPVISSHAALAVFGLIVWVTYLITGDDQFAYATLAILAGVVCLGVTLAFRWVKVVRTTQAPPKRAALAVPATATIGPSGVSVFEPASGAGTANGYSSANGSSLANGSSNGVRARSNLLVPPERHFPMAVVIGHGVFAVTTVVLVLLTVLGFGGN